MLFSSLIISFLPFFLTKYDNPFVWAFSIDISYYLSPKIYFASLNTPMPQMIMPLSSMSSWIATGTFKIMPKTTKIDPVEHNSASDHKLLNIKMPLNIANISSSV